jgi:hypothetical protein
VRGVVLRDVRNIEVILVEKPALRYGFQGGCQAFLIHSVYGDVYGKDIIF